MILKVVLTMVIMAFSENRQLSWAEIVIASVKD